MSKPSPRQQQEINALDEHLLPVVGGTISEAGGVMIDGEVYPAIIVTINGKTLPLIALTDPEGNGPGFLEFGET